MLAYVVFANVGVSIVVLFQKHLTFNMKKTENQDTVADHLPIMFYILPKKWKYLMTGKSPHSISWMHIKL